MNEYEYELIKDSPDQKEIEEIDMMFNLSQKYHKNRNKRRKTMLGNLESFSYTLCSTVEPTDCYLREEFEV